MRPRAATARAWAGSRVPLVDDRPVDGVGVVGAPLFVEFAGRGVSAGGGDDEGEPGSGLNVGAIEGGDASGGVDSTGGTGGDAVNPTGVEGGLAAGGVALTLFEGSGARAGAPEALIKFWCRRTRAKPKVHIRLYLHIVLSRSLSLSLCLPLSHTQTHTPRYL